MKALIQRVSSASVEVNGQTVGQVGKGLLVFLGIDRNDTPEIANGFMGRLLHYRVFADDEGKMNRSVQEVAGAILLVSQFTLSADTRKGLRPSFSSAAAPAQANALFDHCVAELKRLHSPVETGVFGADMQVSLVNDGPVTFLLES